MLKKIFGYASSSSSKSRKSSKAGSKAGSTRDVVLADEPMVTVSAPLPDYDEGPILDMAIEFSRQRNKDLLEDIEEPRRRQQAEHLFALVDIITSETGKGSIDGFGLKQTYAGAKVTDLEAMHAGFNEDNGRLQILSQSVRAQMLEAEVKELRADLNEQNNGHRGPVATVEPGVSRVITERLALAMNCANVAKLDAIGVAIQIGLPSYLRYLNTVANPDQLLAAVTGFAFVEVLSMVKERVPPHTIDWAGLVTTLGGDTVDEAEGLLEATTKDESGEEQLPELPTSLPHRGAGLDPKTRFVRSLAINAATQQAVYIDLLEAEVVEVREELIFRDAKRLLLTLQVAYRDPREECLDPKFSSDITNDLAVASSLRPDNFKVEKAHAAGSEVVVEVLAGTRLSRGEWPQREPAFHMLTPTLGRQIEDEQSPLRRGVVTHRLVSIQELPALPFRSKSRARPEDAAHVGYGIATKGLSTSKPTTRETAFIGGQTQSLSAWAGDPLQSPTSPGNGEELDGDGVESEAEFEPEVLVPQGTLIAHFEQVPAYPMWQPGGAGKLDCLVELPYRTAQSSFLIVEGHVVTTPKNTEYGGYLFAMLPPPREAKGPERRLQIYGYCPPGNSEFVKEYREEWPLTPVVRARTCGFRLPQVGGGNTKGEVGLLSGFGMAEQGQEENARGEVKKDEAEDEDLHLSKSELVVEMEEEVGAMREALEHGDAAMAHTRVVMEKEFERRRWLRDAAKEHDEAIQALDYVIDDPSVGQRACQEQLEQRTQAAKRILYSLEEINKSGGRNKAKLEEAVAVLIGQQLVVIQEVILPDITHLANIELCDPQDAPQVDHIGDFEVEEPSYTMSESQKSRRTLELEMKEAEEVDAIVARLREECGELAQRLDRAWTEQGVLADALREATYESRSLEAALGMSKPTMERRVGEVKQLHEKLQVAKASHDATRKALKAVRKAVTAPRGGGNVDLQVTAAIYAAFLALDKIESNNET